MLAVATPDFRLFWSAYDPLDLASGSIDVLGLQAGYLALANKFLPGFTTVTTSPRYVSMLCAAVAAAETAHPGSADGSVRLRQLRLTAVKSYERAWGLACGLAVSDEKIGDAAVDGLRGIQSVRRRLSELSNRDKSIRTSSFNLLSNQVRYGGIGAYSTMIEDCRLASMRSLSLRPYGGQLAEAFSNPATRLPVWDEDASLPLDALREWGRVCHLSEYTDGESEILAAALRGGEEGRWDDEVRWTFLRLLAQDQNDTDLEQTLLGGILDAVQQGIGHRLKLPPDCLKQVEATLTLMRPYERLYQAVQFLFDAVRAAASDEPEISLETVSAASPNRDACDGARSAAVDLLRAMEETVAIHSSTVHDFRKELTDAGIMSFTDAIGHTLDDPGLFDLVLDRHRDVQHGKFDRGERKATWVHRDPARGRVRLTAQRHQLQKSGRFSRWEHIPWHPYRTFGARRFARACGLR